MDVARARALHFLLSRSADTTPHLNGTLLDHLVATEELLRSWGSPEELCLAGLCHATYGTDGFAPVLLSPRATATPWPPWWAPTSRSIVYLYASCDRAVVYPQLAAGGPVRFPRPIPAASPSHRPTPSSAPSSTSPWPTSSRSPSSGAAFPAPGQRCSGQPAAVPAGTVPVGPRRGSVISPISWRDGPVSEHATVRG